jgi:hypothetical protein
MTTADIVRARALELARSGIEHHEAVHQLEAASEGRRVAVVRARQETMAELEQQTDPVMTKAVELLEDVLRHMPV